MPATGQAAMRPAARFIRIVAIFLLIGPPVGGITVWVASLSDALNSSDLWILLKRDAHNSSELWILPKIILLSYPFGGLFALACGIAHAVAAIWLRWNSVLVPLIAGSVLSAVFVWLFFRLPPLGIITLGLAPMFAASLICWRLTRRIARSA
jgi:hypothetical protein